MSIGEKKKINWQMMNESISTIRKKIAALREANVGQ
jgi:hypothetical protein